MDEQLQQTNIPPNSKRKSITVLSGIAVLLLAIFAVNTIISSNTDQPTAKVATVRVTDRGFEPATLSVKAGTKITWTSADNSLHQVTSNPYPTGGDLSSLKSGILNDAQTYTYLASKTGSFQYHDQMNPTINGTIVVEKQ